MSDQMNHVEFVIYSRDNCPACDTAISLCKAKGVSHKVLKLGVDYTPNDLKEIAPTARTLPQIFMGKIPIGGLDNLRLALK